MSAHSEIADVVEEDNSRGTGAVFRFHQQSTDDDIGAAWFVDDGGAERIKLALEYPASLGDGTGAQIRTAGENHARRLASGVGIDDEDLAGFGFQP